MRFSVFRPTPARLIGLLALVAFLLLESQGFFPHLTDQHAFRQAQTAIVAAHLQGWSDLLRYELPVLGAPWSVPFEFPLYQALAKGLSVLSGLALNTSGRVVGIAGFGLALLCLGRLCRQFDVKHPALVCAFAALTPLYVFWSRAFMIETMALGLTLAFATVTVDLQRARQVRLGLTGLLAIVGMAAVLTKVTTLLPVLLLATGVQLIKIWREHRMRLPLWPAALPLAAQGAVLLVGAGWVRHADGLKAGNPLAEGLTSQRLTSWNWGTLEQRLDPEVWSALLERTSNIYFPAEAVGSAGRALALFVALLALFGLALRRCAPERRCLVGLCLGLFAASYLCFVNLHFVHNYYQCANAIFLSAALGLAFEGAISQAEPRRSVRGLLAAYALGLALLAACSALTLAHYANQAERGAELARRIRQTSAAGKAIVIAGQDWSPQTPYQAGRRALMLWERSEARVKAALALQSRADYDLYVACGPKPLNDALFREAWGLAPSQAALDEIDGCRLYRLNGS